MHAKGATENEALLRNESFWLIAICVCAAPLLNDDDAIKVCEH